MPSKSESVCVCVCVCVCGICIGRPHTQRVGHMAAAMACRWWPTARKSKVNCRWWLLLAASCCRAQIRQEWHCGTLVVSVDQVCFQYYLNVTLQTVNYCCDKAGYFCQRKQTDVFNANHVVRGNFRAGKFTSATDGSGSDRPGNATAGICSIDRSRLNTRPTPLGLPDCGAGSRDPTNDNYCTVEEEKVCLDTGECGVDCGMGHYGGTKEFNYDCHKCPQGTWSDKRRAGSADTCQARTRVILLSSIPLTRVSPYDHSLPLNRVML